MKKEKKITPIRNGTVIDHITAGQALIVLKILGINTQTDTIVSVAMNVPSRGIGKKDLVMIEDRELNSNEVDRIALIAPRATINIIKDEKVIKKHKVHLPEIIEGILKCQNPNCISNAEREPIISEFTTIGRNPPQFRCLYCGKIIKGDVASYIK